MDPLVWAIILLAAGLTLAVLELFIPSGGMIGLLSLVSIVGSIWMAFKHGSWTGLGFTSLAVMAVPVVLAAAFKVWPHTRFGRRILLDVPAADAVRPDSDVRRSLRSLVGKTGVAQSLMTPNGAIEVDGQVIDAVSEGVSIEAGQAVRIVEVRGMRVVVRPATSAPPPSNDPLAQPIESLGLDPFEDPLA